MREERLEQVKTILGQYRNTPITVRQLYYRMVANGYVPNSNNSYKGLVQFLSAMRKSGEISFDAFVDRTRGLQNYDFGWHKHDPKAWLIDDIDRMLNSTITYDLNAWYGQPNRVIVAVEKQALEGVFVPICRRYGINLAVCRGYPSLTFVKEIADYFGYIHEGQLDDTKDFILYFGDYDPSGINIPETLEENLKTVFDTDFVMERIALNESQTSGLIPAPVKTSDKRSGKFIEDHGTSVYELDAIEPDRLQNMIASAIEQKISSPKLEKRKQIIEDGRMQIKEMMNNTNLSDAMELIRKVRDDLAKM